MSWPTFIPPPGPRDWPEDAERDDDNGCYQNRCILCKETFVGHKRRAVCKECDAKDRDKALRRAELLHGYEGATGTPMRGAAPKGPDVAPLLVWSSALPTQPGWYWSRVAGLQCGMPVHLVIDRPHGAPSETTELGWWEDRCWYSVRLSGCSWAGPIPEPFDP